MFRTFAHRGLKVQIGAESKWHGGLNCGGIFSQIEVTDLINQEKNSDTRVKHKEMWVRRRENAEKQKKTLVG